MKKIRGFIRYPLVFDMKTYSQIDLQAKYELTGIVVHWGTLEHGHYISVINKSAKWFYCNDRNIGECEEKLALS